MSLQLSGLSASYFSERVRFRLMGGKWLAIAIATVWTGFSHIQAAEPGDVNSVEDLVRIQKMVQSVLPNVEKALVAIEFGAGAASGVIVSPKGLVLTAAHVTSEVGNKYKVTLHDGRTVEGTSLGLDTTTDSAMLQLPTPAKEWPFVAMDREVHRLHAGQWCFALGHPGGHDESRGRVLRIGRVVKVAANMMQSDCVLMAGDSGGGLFNLRGELIGIHSLIWQGREQNIHVSMAPFMRNWEAMKRGDVIRVWQRGSGGWIGLSSEPTEDGNGVLIQAIAPNSPAEKAQLKQGDRIVKVNKESVRNPAEFSTLIRNRPAGEIVTLEIWRPGDEQGRITSIKLQSRPSS